MLISFSVGNWRSYRDRVSFSMIAGDEKEYEKRLPFLKEYGIRVLPITAIYGGNASGKSNFFKALHFVKKLVVKGTQPETPINREYFRLNPEYIGKPSYFSAEIFANETIYEFSFSANNESILDEKLVEINASDKTEKILYSRIKDQTNFNETLKDIEFLNFAFKATRNNQLFLTNSVFQNIEYFKPVYDWFRNTLDLISPNSGFNNYEHFLNEDDPLSAAINKELESLDTGIVKLGGEDIPSDDITALYGRQIGEYLKEGEAIKLSGDHMLIRKDGEMINKKLVTHHKSSDGNTIKFEMSDESDGSRRAIDLLPAFLGMAKRDSKKVYIIDELDRSLHVNLTKNLVDRYLSNCTPESRSQLLFTTHDALLMSEELLRRDEMWLTERDDEGSSSLYPVSDFKDAKDDKDLSKSYLQGRMGGVPFLRNL